MRRGGQGQARVGEAETVEPLDREPGGPDRRGGVTAGVVAAHGWPQGHVEQALRAPPAGSLGADMLKKRSWPPGRRTRRISRSTACWLATLHRTKVATAASNAPSPAGSSSATPSVTSTGTGADDALP